MSDEKKETKLYVPPPTGKVYWKGQMKTYLLIVFNFVLVLLVDILLLHDTAFLQYDRQTVMIVFAAAVSLLESWIYGKVRKKRRKQ